MSKPSPGTEKLDSWKEIATYLDRDVRTVIRWETRRGLPVRRLPGGQAVFAYKHELDAWLKQGQKPISSTEEQVRGRRFISHHAFLAAGMLIATVCVLVFFLSRSKTQLL